MARQDYKVECVPVNKIKEAPFNPPDRTAARRLVELRKSIERHGILQPLVITKDFELADGHRRLACAKELGMECVPCHIANGTVSELWGANAGIYSVKPATWMAAVDGGLNIEDVAPGTREIIKELRRILKPAEFHELAKLNRSPGIYNEARRIAAYVDRRDDDEFKRKTILWLNTHKMRYVVRTLYENDIPKEIIHDAIIQNRPLERHWSIA